jgi:uncharacterized membrane protein
MERQNQEVDESSKISLKRLQTLTDCIFALCLMLLVIFIEKPPEDMKPTEENIRKYLFSQLDVIAAYLVTFLNIAFYWFFTHSQGKYLRRSSGVHVWLTVLTLMFVGLLPYANALNTAFPTSFTVQVFYSAVVFFVGLLFCIDWLYATRNDRLVDRSINPGTVEELIVESLVQPIAAILSIGGAFIGIFWWELPFLLVPIAVWVVSKIWERKRRG